MRKTVQQSERRTVRCAAGSNGRRQFGQTNRFGVIRRTI
jgi:hypothetical protein